MATFQRIAIVCLLMAATAVPTWAQQFKSVKPLSRGATQRAMSKILKGEVPYDKKTADDYYRKTLLATLTLPPRKQDGHVRDGLSYGQVKSMIMRDLETVSRKNQASHAALVKDLLSWCAGFTKPENNYSPAVQYNAMLIIASLNDKEPTNSTLPVPSKKAYGTLYKGMSSSSDPVAVAALIGVLRHAELHRLGSKMPAQAKKLFSAAAYKIVKADCPESRSESGHEWMQRRALQILGAFGDPGKGNGLAKFINSIVLDEDASVAKRCTAIETLGRLNMTSADGVDVPGTTVGLATTTALVCRQVSNRLFARYVERENNGGSFEGGGGSGYGGGGGGYGGYGGGGGAGGYGGYGGGGGGGGGGYGGYGGGGGGYGGYGGAEEEEDEVKVKEDPLLTEARRDLKFRLGCVQMGVQKFLKLSPDDKKLADLNDEIQSVLNNADEEELKVSTFQQKVAALADSLEDDFDIETDDKNDANLQMRPAAPRRRGNSSDA